MNKYKESDIAIIGAGYVGLCTGVVLNELGYPVTFIDVNEERVNILKKGVSPVYEPGLEELIKKGVENGTIKITSQYDDISHISTFIISVNTPIMENYEVNLEYLISACDSLAKVIKKNSTIIVRSTVPPLTIRECIIPIFNSFGFQPDIDLIFASVPERLAEGHALRDMKENPIIIGSNSKTAFEKVKRIWADLNLEFLHVSWEEAELTKLADNLWIDLNIALANELALISEKIYADARKVINAANTLKKGNGFVNILTPGAGVGGSCLPKDPHILDAFAKKHGVTLKIPKISRSINDSMPSHMFDIIMQKQRSSKDKKTLLLGLSFNSNSGDMRYSPSIELNKKLRIEGFTVYGYDPLVNNEDLKPLIDLNIIKTKEEFIDILKHVDTIAVLAAHDIFRNMIKDILQNLNKKTIVDGRYLFIREEVIKAGGDYFAIGVGYK